MSKNTFMNALKKDSNITSTENGGTSYKSTLNQVLDLFSLGGAYRERTDDDCILLFKNAYEQDPDLATKCLFYLRDREYGQGERRFFRVCYRWLAETDPNTALINMNNVPAMGRWDDLIYSLDGTPLEFNMMDYIHRQFQEDLHSETPSLLAKWMPSCNSSSLETKRLGRKICSYFNLTQRQYRKSLSLLRERINIVERLMSENKWDDIDFSKLPSRAGLIYRNTFARRDETSKRYKEFAQDKNSKVNAKVLYPNDIAHRAFKAATDSYTSPERLMLQKYWDNLPDFYNGREENAIAVVDVSGSMYGTPLEAAVSLGAYIAERGKGPYANHFITFSDEPELVEFKGIDIVDKFCRAAQADWGGSTNIEAVFDLLLNTAIKYHVAPHDMVSKLYILSDMEFNYCIDLGEEHPLWHSVTKEVINSDIEKIGQKWARYGYKIPQIVFWNLNARHDLIPAIGEGFNYVSGFSPIMVENLLSGKSAYEIMLDKLVKSGRYNNVKAYK